MTIEELEIQIEAETQEASKAIDSLTSSLSSLKTVTGNAAGLNKVVKQLESLNSAAGYMNLSGFTGQMKELVSGLGQLSNLGKNNLTTFITQLRKIPDVTQALDPTATNAFADSISRVTAAVKPLATEMEKITMGFSALPKRIQSFITQMERSSKGATTAAQGYKSMANSLNSLNAKVNFVGIYYGLKKVAQGFMSLVENASQYIEDINLVAVSLGELAGTISEYANQAQRVLGIDAAEFMKNTGIFKSIAAGLGVASDAAVLMGQNLTQLGYDLASFYNISNNTAFEKLQSAIVGQTKPMMELGVSVHQATLEEVALRRGIDQSVSSMTEAQKVALRYVAIMDATSAAQGDLAATLQSPSNQMRIFSQQVTLLSRSLGNLLIPVINKVLPYLMALVKALRMAADAIASLFGVSLPTVETADFYDMSSAVNGAAGGADDLESSLGGAADQAKSIRDYVMGFDELNIIRPEDAVSGTGAGTGVGAGGGDLGIDLPTYDFLAGLSEQADELIPKMQELLKIIGVIAAGLLAFKAIQGIANLVDWFSRLSSAAKTITGLAAAVAGIVVYVIAFNDAWKNGVNWINLAGMIAGATLAIVGLSVAISPVVGGIAGVAAGIGILAVSIKDIVKNGANLKNIFGLLSGGAVTIAGLVTAFGKWGAVLSPFKTIFTNLKSAFAGFKTDVTSFVPAGSAFGKNMKEMSKQTQNMLSTAQKATVAIAGIAVAAVTVYTTVKDLAKSIFDGTATFADFAKAGLILVPVLVAVGVAMYSALGPLGLILLAITAVIAAVAAVTSAFNENQKAINTNIIFSPNGGKPVQEIADNFLTLTESINATSEAILANKDEMDSLTGSIELGASAVSRLSQLNYSTLEEAQTVLPMLAEEYAKLSDDVIRNIELAGDVLRQALITTPQEAYDQAGTTFPALAESIASAVSGASEEIIALRNRFDELIVALEQDPDNEDLKEELQDVSRRIMEMSGITTNAADEYTTALDSMEPVDFSALAAGDPSEAQTKLEELVKGINEGGAEAQKNLAESYAAIQDSLDTLVASGQISEEDAQALRDTYAAAFEIESQKITDAQTNAIADIRTGFEAAVDDVAANVEPTWYEKLLWNEETARQKAQERVRDSFSGIFDVLDTAEEAATAGKEAAAGLAQGLREGDTAAVESAAKQIADLASDSMKEALDEHSPSKVTQDIGVNAVKGFTNGLGENTTEITKAAKDIADGLLDQLRTSLGISTGRGSKGGSSVTREIGESVMESLGAGFKNGSNGALSALSEVLNVLLSRLQDFANRFKDGVNETLSNYSSAMSSIQQRGNSISFAPMPSINIPAFAAGGMVTSGQLFVARENGMPEMVGRFGTNTGVANNQQITDGIASAVYDAIVSANSASGSQGQPIIITLDGRTIFESSVQQNQSYGYQGFRQTAVGLG